MKSDVCHTGISFSLGMTAGVICEWNTYVDPVVGEWIHLVGQQCA